MKQSDRDLTPDQQRSELVGGAPSSTEPIPRRRVLAGRPPAKPWAHRHRLVPLYVDRLQKPGLKYRYHVGYKCADIHCDELFTQTGNVSNPTPHADDRRPVAKLFREGENHKARRLARAAKGIA